MDEIVDAKIEVIQALESAWSGSVAVLNTRRGDEYHVWIAADGHPLIKKVDRRLTGGMRC